MPEKLIETITLPNGLILELWDKSRPMAGDRWLIALLAKVEVPVLPEYFSTLNNSEQAYRDLLAAYSDPLVFTQEKTRHFVDEKNIDDVLAELCQRIPVTKRDTSSPSYAFALTPADISRPRLAT